jgi:hypothetical protein
MDTRPTMDTRTCPRCKAPVAAKASRCPQCDAPLAVERGVIGGFLAENWAWILAPVVFAFLILVFVLFFLDQDTSPFIYNIF